MGLGAWGFERYGEQYKPAQTLEPISTYVPLPMHIYNIIQALLIKPPPTPNEGFCHNSKEWMSMLTESELKQLDKHMYRLLQCNQASSSKTYLSDGHPNRGVKLRVRRKQALWSNTVLFPRRSYCILIFHILASLSFTSPYFPHIFLALFKSSFI